MIITPSQKMAHMGAVKIGDKFRSPFLSDGRMVARLKNRLKRGHDPEMSMANKSNRIKRVWIKLRAGRLAPAVAAAVAKDYAKQFAKWDREALKKN